MSEHRGEIEAFEFWAEDVQKAAADLDVTAAIDKLERLRSAIDASSAGVLLSHRMNSYFDTRQFLMLLDHLLRTFQKSAREA
jgi:hypothetical protein